MNSIAKASLFAAMFLLAVAAHARAADEAKPTDALKPIKLPARKATSAKSGT
jgi:hypothetical protein